MKGRYVKERRDQRGNGKTHDHNMAVNLLSCNVLSSSDSVERCAVLFLCGCPML